MNAGVTWVIENIAKESSYIELSDAVKRAGLPIIDLRGDFRYELIIGLMYPPRCVIFNGSIEMSKIVKQHLTTPNSPKTSCYPISYNTFEKYKCSAYYSYFGEYLFNDKYALCTLKELQRNRFFYYGTFGKEGVIFVRPDSGEKTFQAQLVDIIDLDRFVQQNEPIQHQLVLVSTPKSIRGEWRIVMSKSDIIDYSMYVYQGQISKIRACPPEVLTFAKKLLDIEYYPDSVFCFDVCQDSDGAPWLLELTSFSSAGLYACNKDNIVREVSKIASQDYQVLHGK